MEYLLNVSDTAYMEKRNRGCCFPWLLGFWEIPSKSVTHRVIGYRHNNIEVFPGMFQELPSHSYQMHE